MGAADFEITSYPSDLGKAIAAGRYLLGTVWGDQAKDVPTIGLAATNLGAFALGQALGQPGEAADDGPTIFKLTAETPALSMDELKANVELVVSLEDGGDTLAAKKIPWLQIALALFELWRQYGGKS